MEDNKQMIKSDQVKPQMELSASPSSERIEQLLTFGATVVKSGLTPLKKPEDVVVAVLTGEELGITAMASVNNIYSINGRGTLGVHLIKGLLLSGGVIYKVMHDYQPMYNYAMKGGDGKADKNAGVIVDFYREPKEHELRGKSIVDWGSLVKFTRKIRMGDGSWTEMIEYGKFTWSEAVRAKLVEKDNWQNYPRMMVTNRAFTFGSRNIAPDLMMGLGETTEMLDANNITYSVDPGSNDAKLDDAEEVQEATVVSEETPS